MIDKDRIDILRKLRKTSKRLSYAIRQWENMSADTDSTLSELHFRFASDCDHIILRQGHGINKCSKTGGVCDAMVCPLLDT